MVEVEIAPEHEPQAPGGDTSMTFTETRAPKPRFRGLSHLFAFSSALTLAPLLIVFTPGIEDRFIMAIYAVSVSYTHLTLPTILLV